MASRAEGPLHTGDVAHVLIPLMQIPSQTFEETGKAVRIEKAVTEMIRWFSPQFCFYSRHPFPPK